MKLYTFDELSDKAKETAINDYRHINIHYDWWQPSYDTWNEVGLQILHFDLYKQDLGYEFFDNEEDVAENILVIFGHNEFYDFAKQYLEAKKKLDIEYEENEEYDLDLDELNSLFNHDLKLAILHWLEGEYEYLQSDESVADTLEANEFEFTEYGKRFHL